MDHGLACSFKEIKKKNRVEIKGIADNGKERLLQQEIIEKYGIDVLEESEGYNTLFPVFKEGVITSKTEELGTYYTHFVVKNESDEEFDLELYDYRFYNSTFYLQHMIYIEGLAKKTPILETKTSYGGINSFFLDHFSRQELHDFSEYELDIIKFIAPDKNQEPREIDSVTSITLSTFRVLNFIKEYDEKNESNECSFLNNEYFIIKKWTEDSDLNGIQADVRIQTEKYLTDVVEGNVKFKIVDNHFVGRLIHQIIENEHINKFYVAVGFAFQSGLKILEPDFQKVKQNSGDCEFVLGSLQNFDDERANNKIDKGTVMYLNRLLENKNITLYTYNDSFYHGKFYYMSNDEKVFVIIGSSNISKTAFDINYEMDVIHVMDRGSEEEKQFLEWYLELKEKCKQIEIFNENNFGEYNWTSELDAFHSLKNQRVSMDEMRRKIENLSDEELKYRLTLWMNKNPTERYEEIGIEALKDYIMFVYAENRLVVFEAFMPGNAYYVFKYRNSLVDLLSDINCMSKTQMTCSVHYVKKGYHMQSRENLTRQINKYFK